MSAAAKTAPLLAFDPTNVAIPEDKIRKYLLDPTHPEGGAKAKFFLAGGFSDSEWLILDHALRHHPIDNAVESTVQNDFGVKYMVRCTIRTPDGRNPCILTVWMVDGPGAARFVTARPA